MDERTLRKHLYNNWKPCNFTSIEGAFSYGMPDSHVTVEGNRAWIELKVNYSNHLLFRPNQLAWMEREYKLGMDTWVVWFDSALRATTYTFLREWGRSKSGEKVKVPIFMPEVFTGSYSELKKVIFGGLQEDNSSV